MLPLNSPLPADVMALRDSLPVKPAPITLQGQFVTLIPTDLDRDTEILHHISNGSALDINGKHVPAYDAEEMIWRFMFNGPFESAEAMRTYMKGQVDAPNGLPYTVIDNVSGHAVGVINYMNNSPKDLKIELGSIWYSPIAQRTHANLESTYLTLKNAFDLGYRRVEWKCNSLNERSRKSALRMGFLYEGTQEAHMIVKERNRDTSWFRVLGAEWPSVQPRLEALLAQHR